MNRTITLRVAIVATVSALALIAVPATAGAQTRPGPIDESRMVPTLIPSFTPWTCKTKQAGPVGNGERHLTFGWELTDFPCAVPVYNARDETPSADRFYDWGVASHDIRRILLRMILSRWSS